MNYIKYNAMGSREKMAKMVGTSAGAPAVPSAGVSDVVSAVISAGISAVVSAVESVTAPVR